MKLHTKSADLFEKIIAEDPLNFEASISLAHVYGRLAPVVYCVCVLL